MKTQGLDGREYPFPLEERAERVNTSAPHRRARAWLRSLYPLERIHEEVFLPGCGTPLFGDFLLPRRKLLVEVHGRQHYEEVPHFGRLARQRERDQRKRQWCALNGWTLIELPGQETEDEWRDRLFGHRGSQPAPGPLGGGAGISPSGAPG